MAIVCMYLKEVEYMSLELCFETLAGWCYLKSYQNLGKNKLIEKRS